jgi:hypothetical protein
MCSSALPMIPRLRYGITSIQATQAKKLQRT